MSQGCFSESQPRLSKLWTHQGIPGGSSSNASASEKLIQSIHQRQLTSRPFSRRLVTPMVVKSKGIRNPNGRNLQVTDLKKKLPFQNPSLVGLRMGIDADPRAEPELDCKEDDLLKFSGTLVINHHSIPKKPKPNILWGDGCGMGGLGVPSREKPVDFHEVRVGGLIFTQEDVVSTSNVRIKNSLVLT